MVRGLQIGQKPIQFRSIGYRSAHAFVDVNHITPSLSKGIHLQIHALIVGGNPRISSFHFEVPFMND
jgi:hypothetical protein